MSKLKDIIEDSGYEEVTIIDGYDEAVLGISEDGRLVYDFERMVEIEYETNDCSMEEAREYIDYNILGFYHYFGNNPPIIMFKLYD